MKKTLKGYVLGLLTASILIGSGAMAANTVKIVVDNKEIIPTDTSGNRVDPIIIDGTTYLPVRAVANAFGKAVYWDGETSTVYLGNHDGDLEYPTLKLSDATNIGGCWSNASTSQLKDNYDNYYGEAKKTWGGDSAEFLLNSKYSRFKGTIYVMNGETTNNSASITIEADGKNIYTSPEITKASKPINIDVSVKGCNDLKINTASGSFTICIGDAGFYQ